MDFKYDVIVIGAGHAGCEAAAAQLLKPKNHKSYKQLKINR